MSNSLVIFFSFSFFRLILIPAFSFRIALSFLCHFQPRLPFRSSIFILAFSFLFRIQFSLPDSVFSSRFSFRFQLPSRFRLSLLGFIFDFLFLNYRLSARSVFCLSFLPVRYFSSFFEENKTNLIPRPRVLLFALCGYCPDAVRRSYSARRS